MGRSSSVFKIVVIALFLVAAVLLILFVMAQNRIPQVLEKEFGLQVSIADTHFGLTGPKLVLTDFRMHQPLGYGPGEALTVDKVVVSFDGFSRNPLVITSIGLENITGNVIYANNRDNFSMLQQIIDNQYHNPVSGWGKIPAVIQTVQLPNAHLVLGNTTLQLPDRNSQPIGSIAKPIPFKAALALAIIKVLENEKQGIPPLAVDRLKSKTVEVIQKLGEKFRDFMNKPAGYEFFDPPAEPVGPTTPVQPAPPVP